MGNTEALSCPKCGGEMDEGFISGYSRILYMPGSQRRKVLPKTVDLQRAQACLICGYVDRQTRLLVAERRFPRLFLR